MLKLSADNRDLKAKLDEANAKLKSMGAGPKSGIQQLAGAFTPAKIAIAAVIGAVVGLGSKVMSYAKSAIEAQRIQAQLNATLMSTGFAAGMSAQDVNNLAGELSRASGVSRGAVLAGENMLLTFTSIGRDVFPQATEALLDMTMVMTRGNVTAESMQQHAVQVGRALNDPIRGMQALRRVGVAFTDSQEAAVKRMVKTNNIAGAQAIILQELRTEFGGSARAFGETAAGQISRFDNAMAAAKRTAGEQLLPAVSDMARGLRMIVEEGQQAEGWITKLTEAIGGLGSAIGRHLQAGVYHDMLNRRRVETGGEASMIFQAPSRYGQMSEGQAADELSTQLGRTRYEYAVAEDSVEMYKEALIRRYGSIERATTDTTDSQVREYQRLRSEMLRLADTARDSFGWDVDLNVLQNATRISSAAVLQGVDQAQNRRRQEQQARNEEAAKKAASLRQNEMSAYQSYYQFMQDERQADIFRLAADYNKQRSMLDEMHNYGIISTIQYNSMIDELERGRIQQEEDLAVKHNVFLKSLQEDWLKGFTGAYGKFESATKAALLETLSGENGWDAWQKAMKVILQQLVVDLMYAIAKALLLKAVTAAIGGPIGAGGGFIGGLIKGAFFEKGYIPSYANGRIPVLANGMMPADHFPAYIGTREAVINARSTAANAGLLKWINDNPGQQAQAQSVITHTVLNLDGKTLTEVVDRHQAGNARARGTTTYQRRG